MSRDTVAEMAFQARTLDQCIAAEQAMTEWLKNHPDHLELYKLCSQLGLMKLAAQEERNAQEARQTTAV